MHRTLEALARLVVAALALSIAAGCGGGDGVDSGGTGSAPPTFAVGAIDGFGSIIVGSVHYDTDASTAIADEDGYPLGADALQLGAMVAVEGSAVVDTGTRLTSRATAIRVGELLVGPVESVDAASGGLRVLGQTVLVTGGTVFDAALAGGIAALAPGDVVAVSGQIDRAVPRIVATRIAARAGAQAYVLQSVVTAFDAAVQRLTMGGATVDLAALGPLAAAPAPGDVLRLRLRTATLGGAWTATTLRDGDRELATHERVEIEGRVSAVRSATDFDVDGVAVDASRATFTGSTTALRFGQRVGVEGRSANGALTATQVHVETGEATGDEVLEIEGRITALDAAVRTFVIRGVTIAYDDQTRFEGGTAGDLRVDRKAGVKGRLSADGTYVLASQVHVEL